VYFLSHFSLIKPGFTKYPQLHFSKTFSFYTHPDKRNLGMVNCELAFWLNRVTANIFQGKIFHKRNLAIGLRPEKITTIYGGGDPEFIRGHERSGDGVVGFSTAYYKRKDPELIYNIIKNMPHREFILLGKNWQEYEKFEEMKEMKNFTYIDTEYKNYPDYYDKMTVFVSASKREGGPISLIEAMMANIVPVASNTGFAPDLIRQGKNGFIFPENSKTEDVIKLIDKAFDLKTDIRESIKEHTWQKFSEEIYKLSIKEA